MARALVIGDVHGCLEELHELLALLDPSPGDRLFFLGDLVDRGPDSLGVVRLVRDLIHQHPGSVALCGNHEDKWLRRRERGHQLPAGAVAASEDDWSFLEGLPLFQRLPEFGVVLVHGGIFPRFLQHYDDLGEPSPTWRADRGKRADRLRRFLRVRQVNAQGDMLALSQTDQALGHWSAFYDGRVGHCYFGHDPQLGPPEPLRASQATGLDTGCCFGGRLTAAVIHQATGTREIVSVRAHRAYASPRLLHLED